MECRVGNALIHYVEQGSGTPLLALHGAGVDHRELMAGLEPVLADVEARRIYPDLPAMGRTPAGDLQANDDVVQLLCAFIAQLDCGTVALLGHSYGAYLARGIAGARPELLRGLALVCPVGAGSSGAPEHRAVVQDDASYAELDEAQRAGFDEYFVVRTPALARRYRDEMWPGKASVDAGGLEQIFSRWPIDLSPHGFDAPTLIVAGRRDAIAGYADAVALLDQYPRAALTVVEDAGHALIHERPEVVAALLRDWLGRTPP